jgi:AraC-like DNA-binding protein
VTVSRPQPAAFDEGFRAALAEAMRRRSPSLPAVAAQLAISTRTLQRRLAEQGTTWRAELDAARRGIIASAAETGPVTMACLARRLGYADPRSARRTLRRLAAKSENEEYAAVRSPTLGRSP